VIPAQIRTWRKAILGRGDLRTDEAKRAARAYCRLAGWTPQNDDEAEAACIWAWACGVLKAEDYRRIAPNGPLFAAG
jgi:hypothetical protein